MTMILSSHDILNRNATPTKPKAEAREKLVFRSTGYLEFHEIPDGCIPFDSLDTSQIKPSPQKSTNASSSSNAQHNGAPPSSTCSTLTPKRDSKIKPNGSSTPLTNGRTTFSATLPSSKPDADAKINGSCSPSGADTIALQRIRKYVDYDSDNSPVSTPTTRVAMSPAAQSSSATVDGKRNGSSPLPCSSSRTPTPTSSSSSPSPSLQAKENVGVNGSPVASTSRALTTPPLQPTKRHLDDRSNGLSPAEASSSNGQIGPFLKPANKQDSDEKPNNGSALNGSRPTASTLFNRKRTHSDDYEKNYWSFEWRGIDAHRFAKHAPGLYNSRNDCFMNSVLQFVFHTPQLIRFLVESKKHHPCANRCMFCTLYGYYQKVCHSGGQRPFGPGELRGIVNQDFPNRIMNNQEDAHEMLIFLLGKLEPPIPKRKEQEPKVPPRPVQKTEIDRIFGGIVRNALMCTNCGHRRHNFEDIRELNLNLNIGQQSPNNDLTNYIENYFSRERLAGYKCEKCKETQTVRRLTLHTPPNILIIQLKRFRQSYTKNSVDIDIPLKLDLTDFTVITKSAENPAIKQRPHAYYKLYGYISHSGASMSSGHYMATMRGYDSQWYLFDDETVTPTNPQKTGYRQPYVLFYFKDTGPSASTSASSASSLKNGSPAPKKANWSLNNSNGNNRPFVQPKLFTASSSSSNTNGNTNGNRKSNGNGKNGFYIPPVGSSTSSAPSSSSQKPNGGYFSRG